MSSFPIPLSGNTQQIHSLIERLSDQPPDQLRKIDQRALAELIEANGAPFGAFSVGVSSFERMGRKIQYLHAHQAIAVLNTIISNDSDPFLSEKLALLLKGMGSSQIEKLLAKEGKRQFDSLGKEGKMQADSYRRRLKQSIGTAYGLNLTGFSGKQIRNSGTRALLEPELNQLENWKILSLLEDIERSKGEENKEWSRKYIEAARDCAFFLVHFELSAKQKREQCKFLERQVRLIARSRHEGELFALVVQALKFHRSIVAKKEQLGDHPRVVCELSPYREEALLRLAEMIEEGLGAERFELMRQEFLEMHSAPIERLQEELRITEENAHLLRSLFLKPSFFARSPSQPTERYIGFYAAKAEKLSERVAEEVKRLDESVYSSKEFLQVLDGAMGRREAQERLLYKLENAFQEVVDLEALIRNKLFPLCNEALHIFLAYTDCYRMQQKVSFFGLKLLFKAETIKESLPEGIFQAIDRANLQALFAILEHLYRFRSGHSLELLVKSSTKEPSMGLRQLLAEQIDQVEKRMAHLKSDVLYAEEADDEKLNIAVKISQLGATPLRLLRWPFRIAQNRDNEGHIDWQKYSVQLLESGVRYAHICETKNWKEFTQYYMYQRNWVRLSEKMESLGAACNRRLITFSDRIKHGREVEREEGITYEAIEGIGSRREFDSWLDSREMAVLSDDLLFHIFSFLPGTDLISLGKTNWRFHQIVKAIR